MDGGDGNPPPERPTLPPLRKLPVPLGLALLVFLLGVGAFLSSQGLREDISPLWGIAVFLSPMMFAPVVIAGMMGKDPRQALGVIAGVVALMTFFVNSCSGGAP